MSADSLSTQTSSSHTVTAGHSATMATPLLETLQPGKRHAFIQPTADLPTDSLNLARDTLEAFASQVADDQQERKKSKENNKKKRKRGTADKDVEVLKVRKVYVDGFETNQVWQQAKRIIGGVLRHADLVLGEMQDKEEILAANGASDDEGESLEDDSEEEIEVNGDSLVDGEALEDDEDEDEDDFGDEEEDAWEDAEEGLEDELEGEDDEDEDEEDEEDGAAEFVEDADGLNDGFFSLAEFNKQSQWFESQDAKGDPNTDRASDDEEIDWNADPLAPVRAGAQSSRGKKSQDDDEAPEDDDDSEDDGPTFGNMDLDAPEGDSDDEALNTGLDGGAEEEDDTPMGLGNANDIYYKDFFAPPSRKKTNGPGKGKKSVSFAKKDEEAEAAETERAMADVRRDLFDDESEVEDSDDALSDVSAGDPKSRRSAHERRQAKIAEEIRKLEAASVAKREWAMSGEAAAVDRPVNSLLEEDVDFEHVGKPVPVITPQVSEDIEDMIKRRILAQEFDEVLRRRPGMDALPAGTRRGLLDDVDDTKAKKGLAEVYEEEQAKHDNPDTYVSQSDERLQREEREVETMWRQVSSALDALSSWHYRPRPVEPTLSVVPDVATVSMEDAQPATAQGVAGEDSRMAPQEVYTASGKTADKGEVVASSGLPVAKAEMSREDKQRRRRREKERVRKAGGVGPGKTLSGRAKMERDTVADLKKGGVKVINRKGEVTDVQGNKVKAAKAVSSGSYKL